MPVERASGGTSLIDVLDRVLDKGIVIDAWVRVSLVGIDLLTVEARVVVASIDTYIKYSEAVALAPTAAQVAYTAPTFEGNGHFVLLVYPHSLLHDGRGANKPWLLENADPVTKITWSSWVEVNPETARALNVENGEILRVTSPHGVVEAPAYIHPGLRADVVAMPLGFGHTEYGTYAKGRGVNALDLLAAILRQEVHASGHRILKGGNGPYGTVSSSLVAVPRRDPLRLVWRYAAGPPDVTPYRDYGNLGRRLSDRVFGGHAGRFDQQSVEEDERMHRSNHHGREFEVVEFARIPAIFCLGTSDAAALEFPGEE